MFSSTPTSPSLPTHSDLQPRKAQNGLSEKSSSQIRIIDDANSQKIIRETEEQQKAGERLRKAADFENRIRAIEREEELKQRGPGTKRRGSLSTSLFSTSPSTCSRKNMSTSLCSRAYPALAHSSPAPHVSANLGLQFPASNKTTTSMDLPQLLPGIKNLSARRGSTCAGQGERSISKLKAMIMNKLEKNEDAVNPVANALAYPPQTLPSHSKTDYAETTRSTPEFQISNIESSHDGRHSVSPYTISISPSTKDTRISPYSQMTPPPTPPSCVDQTLLRLQKKRRSGSWNKGILNCASNAGVPTKASSPQDRSESPRNYYKKMESDGILKLTLTPNLVRGIDGDVGRIWRGQQSEENYDSDERGNHESGDEEEGKGCWSDSAPSRREFVVTSKDRESGLI